LLVRALLILALIAAPCGLLARLPLIRSSLLPPFVSNSPDIGMRLIASAVRSGQRPDPAR